MVYESIRIEGIGVRDVQNPPPSEKHRKKDEWWEFIGDDQWVLDEEAYKNDEIQKIKNKLHKKDICSVSNRAFRESVMVGNLPVHETQKQYFTIVENECIALRNILQELNNS